jgi:OTU-like cysteine protease
VLFYSFHHLTRAIADQLSNLWLHDRGSKGCGDEGSESVPCDFTGLRALAANYLRAHGEEFAPFLGMTSTDSEYFAHCDKVESVLGAEWGGQLEIMALCSSLRRRIIVFSADAPALVMGVDIPDIDSRTPLQVAYHRHFYALGEHYNSVAPIVKPCACCTDKTAS